MTARSHTWLEVHRYRTQHSTVHTWEKPNMGACDIMPMRTVELAPSAPACTQNTPFITCVIHSHGLHRWLCCAVKHGDLLSLFATQHALEYFQLCQDGLTMWLLAYSSVQQPSLILG